MRHNSPQNVQLSVIALLLLSLFPRVYAYTPTVDSNNSSSSAPKTGDTINGTQNINNGGYTKDSIIILGGNVNVNSGGTANDTTMQAGNMTVKGTVNGTKIHVTTQAARLYIENGGVANDTLASGNGSGTSIRLMDVNAGGVANRTHITNSGTVIVNGGTVNDTWLTGGAARSWLMLRTNARSHRTTVDNGGIVGVYADAISDTTEVNDGGRLLVYNRGQANKNTINNGGMQTIYSGGTSGQSTVNQGGWTQVQSGGETNQTTLKNGGTLEAQDFSNSDQVNQEAGGILQTSTDATITNGSNPKGNFSIENKIAQNVIIEKGGFLDVYSDGQAQNSTINHGGQLVLSNGSFIGGTTTIGGGLASIGTDVVDNRGTLVFNRNFNGGLFHDALNWGIPSQDIVVSGAGSLEQAGLSTLTINVPQAYTGHTSISNGTLALTATGDISGSHQVVLTGNNAILDITGLTNTSTTINRLSGVTGSQIHLGAKDLILNNVLTTDNTVYAGRISGSGDLTKTGLGTQTLSGAGSAVNTVMVAGGMLDFQQAGVFNITGDYTTQSGTVTKIGQQNSSLSIGGKFEQQSGATLIATIGATPDIQAQNVTLNGDLVVLGFTDRFQPVRATDIATTRYTLIRSTNNIIGDFANYTNGSQMATGLDYLLNGGSISADLKSYDLGFRMAWNEGGKTKSTGNFTLAIGTAFDVDIPLTNQAVPMGGFNSGWDGISLTKYGAGRLILSATNTYAGTTTIQAGKLELTNTGNISSSSDVNLTGSTAIFNIAGLSAAGTTINNLSGVNGSQVELGSKNLTINSSQNTAYAGDIAGTGGITKTGQGELTLSGKTIWTGNTYLNSGTLVLDGQHGGAQLTSNLMAQSGTTLSLKNNASFTGSVTPPNVIISSGSIWNMTGNSLVESLTLNQGSLKFQSLINHNYQTLSIDQAMGGSGLLSGNGSIHMNTNLAALQGDKIVTTATAGQHTIHITNRGGNPTRGRQSLLLINVTGGQTASNGNFTLNNGYVDAGAYRYHLVKGNQIANAAPGNWYLYNTGLSTLTYNAMGVTKAAKYATVASLNSLNKRLGELRLDDNHQGDLWVRHHRKAYESNLNSETVTKQHVTGLEIGVDKRINFNSGRLYLGGLTGFGYSKLSSPTNKGEADNMQVGFYATGIFDNGSYVDFVARHFWFKRDLSFISGNTVENGSSKNKVLSLDVEVGHRFKFNQGWFVEPQLELTWLRGSNANFKTTIGNHIELDYGSLLLGRAGVAAGRNWEVNRQTSYQLYGRLDYQKDLYSSNAVNINGEHFKVDKDNGSWIGALGIQAKTKWGHYHLEMELGLGSPSVKQKWGFNTGVRWAF